ncbi:hypothetical protein Tco_0092743 [Tanacetum coccineum]
MKGEDAMNDIRNNMKPERALLIHRTIKQQIRHQPNQSSIQIKRNPKLEKSIEGTSEDTRAHVNSIGAAYRLLTPFVKVYYRVALIFYFIGLGFGVVSLVLWYPFLVCVWRNNINSRCMDKKDDVEASMVWNMTYMMGSLKRLDWDDFLAAASLWFNSLCISMDFGIVMQSLIMTMMSYLKV